MVNGKLAEFHLFWNLLYNSAMRISSTKLFPFLFLVISLFSGCGEDENNTGANTSATSDQSAIIKNDNANISKDDVEELAKIINLPLQPEEATWREDNLDKQSNNNLSVSKGKKLTVVLKFSAEDAQQVVEQVDKIKQSSASDVDAESWFPPELIAKSQESGDENLKGTSYAADNFLREPYKNGKITRIDDTDFFVLELTSF